MSKDIDQPWRVLPWMSTRIYRERRRMLNPNYKARAGWPVDLPVEGGRRCTADGCGGCQRLKGGWWLCDTDARHRQQVQGGEPR